MACDCCVADCTFIADDFNRIDAPTLGGNWTNASGTFAIVSNEAETTSTDAVTRYSAADLSGGLGDYVKVSAKVKATAGRIRVGYVNFTAGINYEIWAEADISGNKLRIIEVDNVGTEYIVRECPFGFSADTFYILGLSTCVNKGIPEQESVHAASVDGIDQIQATLGSVNNPSDFGAIGTGSAAGTFTYDDFKVEALDDNTVAPEDCPPCQTCQWCDAHLNATQVRIVIAGLVDDVCADCDTLNATYILDKQPGLSPDGNPCWWKLALGPFCAGDFDVIRAELIGTGGIPSSFQIQINIGQSGGGADIAFRTDVDSTTPDKGCSTSSITGIPSDGFSFQCDDSGATASIQCISGVPPDNVITESGTDNVTSESGDNVTTEV